MALLIGTVDGVFRSESPAVEEVEHVLEAGNTPRVRTFTNHEGTSTFAATKTGLYRSDDGTTWESLGVPREEVYSVVASPDGDRLYAGIHPAHLYISTDQGETWTELDGFQNLPSRAEWYTPRHRNEAHVRSLGVHSDVPERVTAGVEVGGTHVSDDNSETWTERRDGLQDDVHHVLVVEVDEYVASCGGGLYRTRDAGRSWTRLDTAVDHTYFREAFAYDGRLYAAAARGPPGTWHGATSADAALFESTDGGYTLDAVSYPGSPNEFVLAWTVLDDRVLAGTNEGRLLVRDAERGWGTLGSVPVGIRSLAVC